MADTAQAELDLGPGGREATCAAAGTIGGAGLSARKPLALLHDAANPNRKIADIAFDCGFGDLSYFNRTFRRRYGATASDIRATRRHGA